MLPHCIFDSLFYLIYFRSGDPDIYVSTTEPRPNATSPNTLVGTSFGSDVITISNPTSSFYYISVTSVDSSTFTMLAQFRPNDDTTVLTCIYSFPYLIIILSLD